ncbi:DUF6779 domain-containing protein [Saccharomonospora sp.]|uniref:DUF6779 domain-containing protein n=1 Tax=Saccharomonospora sp. TaxID=33913 RepID=UPI002627C957|nr:DUF6779 domain-containing protein [Saccharomonospora sp.]
MTGVGDDSRNRSASKPWLAVGFLLAIGATLALVLTDDLRWVRLAVVAALWAALIGALMAAKYRRQAALSEKSATKAQRIYELELEKEIAARREHELEVEAETRQRVEAETRDELESLREELKTLRENLQNLFGGEVLWERVALTAQSTRMRKLGEEPRLVTVGEDANGHAAQITVGEDSAEAPDSPTELIGRIRDSDAEPVDDDVEESTMARAEQPRRRRPGAPRTRFVPRPSRPPEDSNPGQQPVDPASRRVRSRPGTAMARASEAASRARAEMSRPHQRPVGRPTGKPGSEPYAPYRAPGNTGDARGAAERSRSAVAPVEGRTAQSSSHDGADHTQQRRRPAVEEAPTRTQVPVDARTAVTPPVAGGRKPADAVRNVPPESSAEATSATEPVVEETLEAAVADTGLTAESRPEPNPTLPPEIRAVQKPGGRRRRAEADGEDTVTESPAPSQSSGGRRYRDDDEEPAWLSGASSGGRRRAPEAAESESDDESTGSHSKGRSVSELLAAYGGGNITPRRRRRAAD